MTQNSTKKIPVNLDNNKSKSVPPLHSAESKEIFSSRKHSMDYVTVDGVILRTGYAIKSDWYLLLIKELLDNATDFLWKKYQGVDNAGINVEISINDSLFHIKVRNTNSKNFPVFQNLAAILDYDMRYGSKQNEHIISRGMLGDAMKQVATWPYVLIHTKDDGSAFTDRQWDKPLIIRSNGIERHVFVHVDKANQQIGPPKITEACKLQHTDTEIETTWPIIDEVNLDIRKIEKFCRQYILFTTDISFKFRLIDNSTDKIDNDSNTVPSNNSNKDLGTLLVNAITSPARKAAIKIDAPAFHVISTNFNNISAINSYKPEEFMARITGVHDKQRTTVYDVLRTFREGGSMKKDADNQVSVAELMSDPDRDKKIETLYHKLKYVFDSKTKKLLGPPERLSLPYSHIKPEERKKALIDRIAQLYSNDYLDANKAAYRLIHETFRDDRGTLHYPFAFEIIAIPLSDNILQPDSNQSTKFIGGVNYSISPRGNKFEGDYRWYDKKAMYEKNGNDIEDILRTFGFSFYNYSDAKTRLPCIIAANLVSHRIDYHGHDKSRIDTQPFSSAIIEAATKIAQEIQTFRAAGYEFYTEREMREFNRPEKKQYKTEDVLMEFFEKRREAMGV